jgi:hypothetical protein
MKDTSGAKTTVTFQGIEVTATKDRLWHVEGAGRSASASSWIRPSGLCFLDLTTKNRTAC